jgi:hypothetical protein
MAAQLTAKRVYHAFIREPLPEDVLLYAGPTRPADMKLDVRLRTASAGRMCMCFSRITPLRVVVDTIRAAAGGSSPEPAPRRHFKES